MRAADHLDDRIDVRVGCERQGIVAPCQPVEPERPMPRPIARGHCHRHDRPPRPSLDQVGVFARQPQRTGADGAETRDADPQRGSAQTLASSRASSSCCPPTSGPLPLRKVRMLLTA